MQARDVLAGGVRALELGDDRVERQVLGVDDARAGGRVVEDLAREQRAGVQADRARGDEVAPAEGQEIGGARAGADEVDGHGFVAAHWTTGICGRQPVKPPIGSAWAISMRVSVPPRAARAATTSCSLSSVTALTTSRPPGRSASQHASSRPGA